LKTLALIKILQSAGLTGLFLTNRSLQQKVCSCNFFFVVTLYFSHVIYDQFFFYFKLIEIERLHIIKKVFFRFNHMWHDRMSAMLKLHNIKIFFFDFITRDKTNFRYAERHSNRTSRDVISDNYVLVLYNR